MNIGGVSRKEQGHLSTQMDQNTKANGKRVFELDLENILMRMVIGTKDHGTIVIRKDMECTITVKLRQNTQVDSLFSYM